MLLSSPNPHQQSKLSSFERCAPFVFAQAIWLAEVIDRTFPLV
jgi:hypothetical protein